MLKTRIQCTLLILAALEIVKIMPLSFVQNIEKHTLFSLTDNWTITKTIQKTNTLLLKWLCYIVKHAIGCKATSNSII